MTNPDGSWTSGLFTQGKVCRYGDAGDPTDPEGKCFDSLNSGVSGTYVGPSGVAVQGDLLPLEVNIGDLTFTLCPAGYCAIATMLCDLEVLSAGSSDTGNSEDEQVVDNDETDGLVPDGTWDDGGFGGACHTSHYDQTIGDPDTTPPTSPGCDTLGAPTYVKGVDDESSDCDSFNTFGCHGNSHAQDFLATYHVWILPSCDYETIVTDDVVLCLVNDWLLSDPTVTADAVACVNDHLLCLLDTPPCNEGAQLSCTADGTADSTNLGQGGGSELTNEKKFPAGLGSNKKEKQQELLDGVPYPEIDPLSGCDGTFATAATFVVTGVDVKIGSFLASVLDDNGGDLIKARPDAENPDEIVGNDKPNGLLAGPGKGAASLLRTLANKNGEFPEGQLLPDDLDPALLLLADTFQALGDGGPSIKYSFATAGWVDWTSGQNEDIAFDDKGIKVNVPVPDKNPGTPPPACADFWDNDDDGDVDGADSNCDTPLDDDESQ